MIYERQRRLVLSWAFIGERERETFITELDASRETLLSRSLLFLHAREAFPKWTVWTVLLHHPTSRGREWHGELDALAVARCQITAKIQQNLAAECCGTQACPSQGVPQA